MANSPIIEQVYHKRYEEEKEISAVKICKNTQGITLDLSCHKLKLIPASVFELSQIQYLYLEGNYLENISPELCRNLTGLTWLDLRRNKLKCLPDNICLLKSLKHLLLEGNSIEKLPLELGMLSQLSGLNLKENPLIYPPESIIQQGVKAILQYLHERYIASDHMEQFEWRAKHLRNSDFDYCDESENSVTNEKRIGYNKDIKLEAGMRRLSFEESLYDNPNELPSLRKRVFGSAPVKGRKRPESYLSDISKRHIRTDIGYMKQEASQSRYQREVLDVEKKLFNEKADSIIQKRISKQVLDEWRRESAKLQRRKRFSKASKHEINLPYGNDLVSNVEIQKKDHQVFDGELEQRIKEHVDNIREWRERDKNSLTIEEHVKAAKQNLEIAQQLHKTVKLIRPPEVSLKTSVVSDIAPPIRILSGRK